MAIQGFFTGDVKIKDLNGVLKAVDGIVEVATDAGTVTSVGLTVGSTGTDVNVANSPITSSGNITLNLPTASATNRGLLSSADWSTFNSKQGTITLTTTGSSGPATLIAGTLNIPNYSSALTGYVPYTGATGNVDLGEYGISSGYFQADLTPSGTLQVGRMQWNSTDGTMDLRLMGNNVTLQIGQEQVARVVNGTGGNLLEANYQAVKIIGAQGQRLQVGLAKADSDANSKDTLGLVTETINNNQEGFVTVSGLVNKINTTGSLQGETWSDGDTLYLSGTTAGAITNIKPTAPIHTVIVGFVAYAHANNGKIYVKVDNGYELEELHDVAATPYINKGVLYRDTATNLWKSATIGTLLGYTPANAATTLTINGTAYDISTNRTWSVGTVTSIGTSGPITGGTITGSGTIGITQATTSTDGYLSYTDWNTFYNKQAAGSYITALTGEATASGPGSATVTLSTSAVTGKLLTGLNLTGGGSIAATDSILQAFGKVQNQISGLAGGVTYQGTWNASTNTPTLTSSTGTKGYYYIVDVAGSTNLNGITDWKVGDWAIFNGSTWDKVDNTDAVSSVNGFTGAVSLTTSNISEGTNLYYLDSRARLALSFTAGSGAYDNTTGVITIPTNTSQLTNGANFITLSSLSASSPLAYNSGTGAFSIQVATGSQNGYLSSTDWTTFNGKQNALTLTTTGSSGSATLVGATLNVPTYTLSGLGGVPTSRQLTINGTAYDLSADRSWSVGTHTGSLTSGYIPKATGSTTLTDGLLYDTGSAVLLGTQTAGSGKFMVYSSTADNHYQAIGTAPSFRFADTITSPTYTGIVGLATASNNFIIGAAAGDMVLANNTSSAGNFLFGTGATERMRISSNGNVSIGTTVTGFNSYGLPLVVGSGSGNQGITVYSGSTSFGSLHFAYGTTGTQSYNGGFEYSHSDNQLNVLAGAGVRLIVGVNQVIVPYNGSHSAGSENFYVQGTGKLTSTLYVGGQLTLASTITNGTYTYTLPSATGTIALVGGSGVGTVTSVAALTIGTSGTDLSSTVANSTTTPVITLNVPTASATNRGALSAADWTTFNNKQNALTNPVTGTGTTNYLPKFTGTSTIGNSIVSESGAALSVAGSIGISGNYPIILNSVSGVSSQQLQYQNNGTNKWQLYLDTSNNSFNFYSSANTANRLTLTEAGNLGLGVTPSAWNSFTVLETQGGSIGASGTGTLRLLHNTYYNGSNWIYKNSAASSRYELDGNTHVWYTAPSGTAGNAISFTQAMTLDASGKLGVGVTSMAAELQVGKSSDVTIAMSNSSSVTSGTRGGIAWYNSSVSTVANIRAVAVTDNVGTELQFYTRPAAGSLTQVLTIASTGAATFSSSVTIQGGNALYVNNAANTRSGSFYTSADGTEVSSFNGAGEPLLLKSPVGYISMFTNGSERLRINTSGNVGIGTTTIDQMLQVAGNISLGRYNVGTSRWIGITNGGGGFGDSSGANIEFTSPSGTSNGINFYTYNGSTYSAKLKISTSGIINLSNVPSSASGLSSGDVYKDGSGFLKIV